MALAARVKVSGVQDLSNARYCAGMGVEFLGFNVDTLSPAQLNEIRSWLAGIQIVAETEKSEIAHLQNIMLSYKPDFIHVRALAKSSLAETTLSQNLLFDTQFISHSNFLQLPESQANKYIVEINASTEIRPGFSNFDGVMEILESLDTDNY
jgi:phosphoribosylanthranilate isomerase